MNKSCCDVNMIHEDKVNKVREQLPEEPVILDLSSFFKVLADPTRLKIVNVLLKEEMCVCDLSVLLDMSQSLISHQLKVLRDSRLVKNRREGKVIFYSLDDFHVVDIIEKGLMHIRE